MAETPNPTQIQKFLGGVDYPANREALLSRAKDSGADENVIRAVTSEPVVIDDLAGADGIETTLEELEGYRIVRAIVCSEVKPTRVVQRDAKSYFAILLDDNNRKPIARLHFNRAQKYLGLFDDNKAETRVPLGSLEDIFDHSEALRTTVRGYLGTAN